MSTITAAGDNGRRKIHRDEIAEIHERDHMRPAIQHNFPDAVVEQVMCNPETRVCSAILIENMKRDRIDFTYWIPAIHDEEDKPTSDDTKTLWKPGEQPEEEDGEAEEESLLDIPESFGYLPEWSPEE